VSGPLGDLFENFRSELGELNRMRRRSRDHYNLGIAYAKWTAGRIYQRIQKVASSADRDLRPATPCQLQHAAGLAFMEERSAVHRSDLV